MKKDIQRAILRACARFIGKKLEPVDGRLKQVEGLVARAATPEQLEELHSVLRADLGKMEKIPGPPGEPGKDAATVSAADLVAELVKSEALAPLIGLMVADAVDKHFETNPVQSGRDGERGEKGEDGQSPAVLDVALASVETAGFMAAVDCAVASYLAENPIKNGEPGLKGDRGENGSRGESGADGKDGIGLSDALIDRDGALVLTMTDGRAKKLGVVVGRDGADGKNGRDGIDFDKCVGHFDAERGYVLTFSAGDTSAEHVLPYMRHGGFWSDGKGAKAGESWTHDGALWIAKRETGAKPCLENRDDWILAARKGRDGKDGRNGIDRTASVKVS
jgi:hypothetical protein